MVLCFVKIFFELKYKASQRKKQEYFCDRQSQQCRNHDFLLPLSVARQYV